MNSSLFPPPPLYLSTFLPTLHIAIPFAANWFHSQTKWKNKSTRLHSNLLSSPLVICLSFFCIGCIRFLWQLVFYSNEVKASWANVVVLLLLLSLSISLLVIPFKKGNTNVCRCRRWRARPHKVSLAEWIKPCLSVFCCLSVCLPVCLSACPSACAYENFDLMDYKS